MRLLGTLLNLHRLNELHCQCDESGHTLDTQTSYFTPYNLECKGVRISGESADVDARPGERVLVRETDGSVCLPSLLRSLRKQSDVDAEEANEEVMRYWVTVDLDHPIIQLAICTGFEGYSSSREDVDPESIAEEIIACATSYAEQPPCGCECSDQAVARFSSAEMPLSLFLESLFLITSAALVEVEEMYNTSRAARAVLN